MASKISFLSIVFVIITINQMNGLVHATVSSANQDMAIDDVMELIEKYSQPNSAILNPAAKLVRLIFHDCGNTGCDGCVNTDSIPNFGLKDMYVALNEVYDENSYNTTGISRADFIVLAATVAVRYTAGKQSCAQLGLGDDCVLPIPDIELVYGREDCPTSPYSDVNPSLPNSQLGLDHVLGFFNTNVGLTTRDTVAILGAHTLGRTQFKNSGLNGPWTTQTTRFDNQFYSELVNSEAIWRQVRQNSTMSPVYPDTASYQWDKINTGGFIMMLNTDMCLYRGINITKDTTGSTGLESDMDCRSDAAHCPLSSTANVVLEFANDNTAFMEAFGVAFQKLSENGYTSGQLTAAEDMSGSSAGNIQSVLAAVMILVITAVMMMAA